MLEIAKFVHEIFEALGIESQRGFIITFAVMGCVLFSLFGWYVDREYRTRVQPAIEGPGGAGGYAKVTGNHSAATGGKGGLGGIGPGGQGGSAEVSGNFSYARGGDGGNSAQWDGRGGPRTLSPGERENLPTSMWPYGYGGHGADAPEYTRRLKILTQLREEYFKAFPDDVAYIKAGVDQVPIRWINKRLGEIGEGWVVEMQEGGYKLPPLLKKQ